MDAATCVLFRLACALKLFAGGLIVARPAGIRKQKEEEGNNKTDGRFRDLANNRENTAR